MDEALFVSLPPLLPPLLPPVELAAPAPVAVGTGALEVGKGDPRGLISNSSDSA